VFRQSHSSHDRAVKKFFAHPRAHQFASKFIIGRIARLTPLARRLFEHRRPQESLTVVERSSNVAVQTLTRRTQNRTAALKPALRRPVRVTLRPSTGATEAAPKASKLEAVEDRLLADALDHHINTDGAVDSALDDMAALAAELHHSRAARCCFAARRTSAAWRICC
jgi:hypothetical protein